MSEEASTTKTTDISIADIASVLSGSELLGDLTPAPEASASTAPNPSTAIDEEEEHDEEDQETEEQEEEGNPNPDDEHEEEEEDPEPDKNPTVEKLQKRINKLTRKHAEYREKTAPRVVELEEQTQRLQAELDAAKLEKTPVTPENPLANIFSEAKLEEQIETSRRVRSWARSNLQTGATIKNEKGEEVEFTPEQVQAFYDQHDDILTNYAPKRRDWIHRAISLESQIKEHLPQYFDPKSEEYAALKKAFEANPQILGEPDATERGIKFALGEAAYASLLKSKKPPKAEKPNKASKPAPQAPTVPSPGAAIPRADKPAKPSVTPLVKKAVESGSRADLTSAVEAFLT